MSTPNRPVDQLRDGLTALRLDVASFVHQVEQARVAAERTEATNVDLAARLASAEAQRLALAIERDSLVEQLAALPRRFQSVVEQYQHEATALVARLQSEVSRITPTTPTAIGPDAEVSEMADAASVSSEPPGATESAGGAALAAGAATAMVASTLPAPADAAPAGDSQPDAAPISAPSAASVPGDREPPRATAPERPASDAATPTTTADHDDGARARSSDARGLVADQEVVPPRDAPAPLVAPVDSAPVEADEPSEATPTEAPPAASEPPPVGVDAPSSREEPDAAPVVVAPSAAPPTPALDAQTVPEPVALAATPTEAVVSMPTETATPTPMPVAPAPGGAQDAPPRPEPAPAAPAAPPPPLIGAIDLVASPFTSYRMLLAFTEAVVALPGVSSLRVRSYGDGAVHYAVTYIDDTPLDVRLRSLPGFVMQQITRRDRLLFVVVEQVSSVS